MTALCDFVHTLFKIDDEEPPKLCSSVGMRYGGGGGGLFGASHAPLIMSDAYTKSFRVQFHIKLLFKVTQGSWTCLSFLRMFPL